MKYILETDFDKIYDKLSALTEDLTGKRDILVNIKGTNYLFVTNFMTQAESKALYNTELLKSSGIYIFEYIPTKDDDKQFIRYYVGKAAELQDRITAHWSVRERDSIALHAAIKEHGVDNFRVAIIETCPQNKLGEEEKNWIETLGTFKSNYDYNLTPGGDGGATVYKVTPEMYQVIRDILATTDRAPTDIANEFSVNRSTIEDINNGVHYWSRIKEIPDQPIRSAEQRDKIKNKAKQEKQSTGAVIAYEDPEHTKIFNRYASRKAAAKELNDGRMAPINRALGLDPRRPNAKGTKQLGYYWGWEEAKE